MQAQLTDGDYAIAKADVNKLRQELGQPSFPSLQSTLDKKTNQPVVVGEFRFFLQYLLAAGSPYQ